MQVIKNFCVGKDCENFIEIAYDGGFMPAYLCPACDKKDSQFNIDMSEPKEPYPDVIDEDMTGARQEEFCN